MLSVTKYEGGVFCGLGAIKLASDKELIHLWRKCSVFI